MNAIQRDEIYDVNFHFVGSVSESKITGSDLMSLLRDLSKVGNSTITNGDTGRCTVLFKDNLEKIEFEKAGDENE